MSANAPSNVIAMSPLHAQAAPRQPVLTTVLHAVADDDGLAGVASVVAELDRHQAFRQLVVHAGAPAFADAVLPTVDHRLDVARGTHGERTAAALPAFEKLLAQERPDVVLVTGEDDATLAFALSAARHGVAVARLESGLRSWDWEHADEVNRTVIDRLADTLFTFSAQAEENLRGEGVPEGRIAPVGNTRVDLLRRHQSAARAQSAWLELGACERGYVLVVLRGPVPGAPLERFERTASAVAQLATQTPVVLLVAAADRDAIRGGVAAGILADVRCADPAGYLPTLSLLVGAGAIVTDVDVVQDDASALGIPCFTLQRATARTSTLIHGTNHLLGEDPAAIIGVRPSTREPTPAAIPMWDGGAGKRVAETLATHYTLALARALDR